MGVVTAEVARTKGFFAGRRDCFRCVTVVLRLRYACPIAPSEAARERTSYKPVFRTRALDIFRRSWSNRVRTKKQPAGQAGCDIRWKAMGHEPSIEVVSMFLMGPREVLVIVIITAVVVWLRVRRRP